MRRRRRRSAFAPHRPERRIFILGAACVAVVAAFIFFMRQAEVLAPSAHETRIELPDAFKQ